MPAVDHLRLRDRRDELDLSNAELARRLEISEGYLGNILYGTDEPSRRLIYRFSRVLEVPVKQVEAARRTPQGDPSEPPEQPPNEPKAPPARKDKRKGPPKTAEDSARVAS
jgi:transcriptional regulator with XRE-family HTH domain